MNIPQNSQKHIRAKALSILYFASKPGINAGFNRLWLSTPILQVRGDKNMKDGMGFSPDSII
jgi:hypothetical protein